MCLDCGAEYDSILSQKRDGVCPACNLKNTRRRGKQTRRARKAAAFVEVVEPEVVFTSDDYECCCCKRKVRAYSSDGDWHEDRATVDHIIALANGGKHAYSNVQTLCHRCNSSKGAR